jgi:hypothetical protein
MFDWQKFTGEMKTIICFIFMTPSNIQCESQFALTKLFGKIEANLTVLLK